MLDLSTGHSADCSGLNRRKFLRVGGLAAFGLSLPQYLRAMAEAPVENGAKAKAKRCILLWMQGGPRTSTRSIPSRTRRPRFAASSARSRPRCPASASPTTCRCSRSKPTSSHHSRPRSEERQPRRRRPPDDDRAQVQRVAAVPVLRLGRRQGTRLRQRHVAVRAARASHRSALQRRHRGLPRRRVQPVRGARRPQSPRLPGPRSHHRQRRRAQAASTAATRCSPIWTTTRRPSRRRAS